GQIIVKLEVSRRSVRAGVFDTEAINRQDPVAATERVAMADRVLPAVQESLQPRQPGPDFAGQRSQFRIAAEGSHRLNHLLREVEISTYVRRGFTTRQGLHQSARLSQPAGFLCRQLEAHGAKIPRSDDETLCVTAEFA